MARIEKLPDGWVTANAHITRSNGEKIPRLEIINLKTKERYHFESTSETSSKALLLASVGIPFNVMMNVTLSVIRFATMIISLTIGSLFNLLEQFSLESIKNLIINITYEIPSAIISTVWALVKVPICAIGMEFCAICAVFSPIKWRVHLASVEGFWTGTSRRYHLLTNKAGENEAKDFFSNPHTKYGLFIAYCFQPLGKLKHLDKNEDGTPKFEIIRPNC